MIINKLVIKEILKEYWIEKKYLIKTIKNDKYHIVIDVFYNNEYFILKKINKHNSFFIKKIEFLIKNKIIYDIEKNNSNIFLTKSWEELFILYKKINWQTLQELFFQDKLTISLINKVLIYINETYKGWNYSDIILNKEINYNHDNVLNSIKKNINSLKNNLKELNVDIRKVLFDYKDIKKNINFNYITHNNLTQANIIFSKKNNTLNLIDFDTIWIWNPLIDILSFLISWYQQNEDKSTLDKILINIWEIFEYSYDEVIRHLYT